MGDANRSFLHDVVSGCVAGVAAAGAVSGVALLFQDQLADFASEFHPTCVQPTGLIEIPRQDIVAMGAEQKDEEGSKPPSNVLDAYLGSLWVPPLEEESWPAHRAVYAPQDKARTLTLTLPSDVDVALVCVNNGLAYSTTAYRNFGRARTVKTWVDDSTGGAVTTTLASQPSDEMQAMQEVGRGFGEATEIHIRLDDAHPGETVETFDPDACGQPPEKLRVGREVVELRFERGCISVASPYAGLSEVVVYQKP